MMYMCKFETIGVQRQYESADKHESDRNFHISCNICCNHGLRIDCSKCAIAVAHEAIQFAFTERGEHNA